MATMTKTPPAPTRRETREAREQTSRTIAPLVDIFETEKAYVLLADLPGVAPGGLDVVAERNALVIRGRCERPDTVPEYQEFELADYYRTFVLTEDLETESISAVLRDGVLRVEIPKSQSVQPKKIPVRTE
jgi:HSP20 family molecular chaperone IbpA